MQLSENLIPVAFKRIPWNKGKLTGAKPPLRPKHVWSIRTKLQMADRKRDLALFNPANDPKLPPPVECCVRSGMDTVSCCYSTATSIIARLFSQLLQGLTDRETPRGLAWWELLERCQVLPHDCYCRSEQKYVLHVPLVI
jgi:hypothetical protein